MKLSLVFLIAIWFVLYFITVNFMLVSLRSTISFYYMLAYNNSSLIIALKYACHLHFFRLRESDNRLRTVEEDKVQIEDILTQVDLCPFLLCKLLVICC